MRLNEVTQNHKVRRVKKTHKLELKRGMLPSMELIYKLPRALTSREDDFTSLAKVSKSSFLRVNHQSQKIFVIWYLHSSMNLSGSEIGQHLKEQGSSTGEWSPLLCALIPLGRTMKSVAELQQDLSCIKS